MRKLDEPAYTLRKKLVKLAVRCPCARSAKSVVFVLVFREQVVVKGRDHKC